VPRSLSVDLLRLDAGTQNRVAINQDVVEDYAELISQSNGKWPFPPLDVFHDGKDFFLANGFHRTLGAVQAKRASIPCEVRKGGAREARIFGMTANDRHGLRMSRADKRACVEWLLDNEPKATQDEIGRKAGVSKRLVQIIVADRKSKKAQIAPQLEGGNLISDKGKPGGGRASSSSAPVSPGPAAGESADSSNDSGKDVRTSGKTPQDKDHRPPGSGKAKPEVSSETLGKCPNCASVKWTKDDFGCVICAKCNHPHGEPRGDADEDRIGTQRSKTVKTAEALMRAFDDLNMLLAKPEHTEAIASCKFLLKTAKSWT